MDGAALKVGDREAQRRRVDANGHVRGPKSVCIPMRVGTFRTDLRGHRPARIFRKVAAARDPDAQDRVRECRHPYRR